MKKLFCFLFIPFLIFSKEEIFVVGTTSGYAPYVSLDEEGSYVGFDIDFAKALATKMGKKLEVKDFGSMAGLMLALKQGKADALIWAISITDERLKTFEMIYYQGEVIDQMPVLFWGKVPENIQTFEDLGKKLKKPLSVEAGSYQESVLSQYADIEIKNLSSVNDAILDLKYGKSVATCIDSSLLPRLQKQYPELKVINLQLPLDQKSLGYGICIKKGNQKLVNEIKSATDALILEGKVEEMEIKWGLKK